MSQFFMSIENNVMITGATLLAHDASTKKFLGYSKVGKIDIGDDVFIGKGVFILPNIRIGNRVIIGVGCVVAKDIPDNSVVIRNPCLVICSFDDYIERNNKLMEINPVYQKHFTEKTAEEKESMRCELEGENRI